MGDLLRGSIVAALVAATLAGCALPPTPPEVEAPPPMEAATDHRAPLKLCQSADTPPASIADKPGYREYAVAVTDASGAPLAALKQSDFVAYSDEQRLPIEFFRGSGGESPVSIVVVLDSSGSMKNKLGVSNSSKIKMVRDSISEVANHLDACDEVALITFGGHPVPGNEIKFLRSGVSDPQSKKVDLAQPFTTDRSLLMSRLQGLHAYGQTPLYDSIHDGLGALAKADYPRRAMIVVTDGMDNTSTTTLDNLIAEVHRSGAPIYSIGMGDPDQKEGDLSFTVGPYVIAGDSDRLDAVVLKQISSASGGETFVVSSVDKDAGAALAAALAKINATFGRGYSIGIVAGEGETPNFSVTSHPDAVIRAYPIALTQPSPAPAASTSSKSAN